MSHSSNGASHQARHLAANPADATFRFSALGKEASPAHTRRATDAADDPDVTRLAHEGADPQATQLMTDSPAAESPHSSEQNGSTADAHPGASVPDADSAEATRLVAQRPTDSPDPEATQLVDSAGSWSTEAAGDAQATRLVVQQPVDSEATRLMPDSPAADAEWTNAPAESPSAGETRLMADADAASADATRLVSDVDQPTRLVSPAEAARLAAVPSPEDAPSIFDQAPEPTSQVSQEATRLVQTPPPNSPDAGAQDNDESEGGELFPETAPLQGDPFGPEDPTNPNGVVLGKNEVAAVPMYHTGYSNDDGTPYISERQAQKTPEEHRHRHKVATIIVTLLLLGAIAGACGYFVHSFMTNTQTEEVPQYTTATIEAGDFVDSIDSTSVLRPVQTSSIVPQVSGTIATINVQNGDQVTAGQTLFTLNNQTITDEATKAKAAADKAQDDVDSKTSDLSSAQKDLDDANTSVSSAQASIEQLLGIASGTLSALDTQEQSETDASNPSDTLKALQKTVSDAEDKLSDTDKQQLTTLESQLQSAKDKVSEAQAKVTSAQSALDTANQSLQTLKSASDKAADQQKKLTVTSPIAGTVTDLDDSVAQGSEVSSSTSLCSVNDTSEFVVTAAVPEGKLDQVAAGQTVTLTFPDVPDLNVSATVDKIGSTASQTGDQTTYPATITISEPDERLQTGMAVKASIVVQSVPDTLIVPVEAVQTDDDGNTYLDVLIDPSRGIDTKVQVTVKATSDTQAAVESPNIQADTKVILPDSDDSDSSDSNADSDAETTDGGSSSSSDTSSDGQ